MGVVRDIANCLLGGLWAISNALFDSTAADEACWAGCVHRISFFEAPVL